MIYIHPTDKIHTPDGQAVFKLSLILSDKTPFSIKSLLVSIITIKKKD